MKQFYPYNLMMPTRSKNEAVKGGILLGAIVLMITGMFIMTPSDDPYKDGMMNVGQVCAAYPEIPQCAALSNHTP